MILASDTQKQVVWDTTAFNNPEEWPEDGSQPFVLSTGDPYVFSPFPLFLLPDYKLESPPRLDTASQLTFLVLKAPATVNMVTMSSAGRVMPSSMPWTTTASVPRATA